MLSLLATGPIPPISISISPDYVNDGLQASYVVLTLIIVISTIWSIRLNRKQSQATLKESRRQSREALKITHEQIAKNEQQAKASLEAVYEQIESSKKQAQDAFYNQIRPILVCTGRPQFTLISMENVGFGVATDVRGMYCGGPTDESPPFSSSFARSMILLPHVEKTLSLLEDDFMYSGSDKIAGYPFYPRENHDILYQSRLLVTYSDAFNNRYFSIFDYNEEYGWKQIALQKTEKTLDELIISGRLATKQYYEDLLQEHEREQALEKAEQWGELEYTESLNEKSIEMTMHKD
jgi:hypothetical protein